MSLDALFGPGTPLAVRFILAFVIVLALIGVLVLVLRRVGPNAVRNGSVRRGPARLGVLEVFQLDTQRKLVILRRDSTEHLVMIGGPNDVLVEANIVRAQPPAGTGDRAAALAQHSHMQQAAAAAAANGTQGKAMQVERPAARAEPAEPAPQLPTQPPPTIAPPTPPQTTTSQPTPPQPAAAPIIPRLIAAQSTPPAPQPPPTSGARFDAALDKLRGGPPS